MVGYHNTLPFLYGLNKARDHYHLILDIPSRCIDYFISGEADIALVPIATLLGRSDYQVVTDYCIGCVGEVGTVCIYSHSPIESLNTIYLDSDSRTSQLLTKVLVEHHWKLDIDFVEVDPRKIIPDNLKKDEGMLMIGDKAFGAYIDYEHVYDLGHEWDVMNNLPFAFALWIARPGIDPITVKELNETLALGVDNIDLVLQANEKLSNEIDLESYFEKYIDFHFDESKQNAAKLFNELGTKLLVL